MEGLAPEALAKSRVSEGKHSLVGRDRRSSNVFVPLGRNSGLMTASDLKLEVRQVLETHRDCKADFVFVINVSYKDTKWEIQKRYGDMLYFKERMAAHINIRKMMKEFPSKMAGKTTFDIANEKLTELNIWLKDFLHNVKFISGSQAERQLFNFIELYFHQPTPKDRMGRCYPDRVLHMGYLRKLGGNKSGGSGNWKRRYMVLQQDLQYFEDEDAFRNGGLPKGVIKLNAFCVERKSDGLLNEFVVHTMPHSLVCRASSVEDMDGWIETLQHMSEGIRSNNRCSALHHQQKVEGEASHENESNEEEITWADIP